MVCTRIGIPHIFIYALRHGQPFMLSTLHNASFFHDDNLVRGNYGRKTMGNHNDRLVLYQRLQSHLHFMLVFRVGESSRFVQHQYRSILQYGTSHTYPLGFAAGQEYTFIAYPCFVALREYTFIAYPCFVALRQTLYEIVALGSFRSGYYLFVRGIWRTYGDILI